MKSVKTIVRNVTGLRYTLDRRASFSRVKLLAYDGYGHGKGERQKLAETLASAFTFEGANVIEHGLTPDRGNARTPYGLPYVTWRGKP